MVDERECCLKEKKWVIKGSIREKKEIERKKRQKNTIIKRVSILGCGFRRALIRFSWSLFTSSG